MKHAARLVTVIAAMIACVAMVGWAGHVPVALDVPTLWPPRLMQLKAT